VTSIGLDGSMAMTGFARRIAVGQSHRLFGWREQPVTHALVVALALIVHDVLRHRTPQVAFSVRRPNYGRHSDHLTSLRWGELKPLHALSAIVVE
jgi:hypothetical protein